MEYFMNQWQQHPKLWVACQRHSGKCLAACITLAPFCLCCCVDGMKENHFTWFMMQALALKYTHLQGELRDHDIVNI